MRVRHSRENRHPVSFLYPGISANQAHALNRPPYTTFFQPIPPTTMSAAKELTSVYEIQITCEINMRRTTF